MKGRMLRLALFLLVWSSLAQAQIPTPTQGDSVLKDFHFNSGESLPELHPDDLAWLLDRVNRGDAAIT